MSRHLKLFFFFAVADSLWDLKKGAWYFVDCILTLVSTFSLHSSSGGRFLAAPFPEMQYTALLHFGLSG